MSDQIPSQAEGEREDDAPEEDPQGPHGHNVTRTTPSQAEGEDTEDGDGQAGERPGP